MKYVIFGILLSVIGCTVVGIQSVRFDYSSMDHNKGIMHSKTVKSNVNSVVEKLSSLISKNQATLLDNKCVQQVCFLIFETAVEKITKTTSQSFSASKGPEVPIESESSIEIQSKYYVFLDPLDNSARVKIIGIPIVDKISSCPQFLEGQGLCTVETLFTQNNLSLIETYKQRWDLDISGKKESLFILQLLKQL